MRTYQAIAHLTSDLKTFRLKVACQGANAVEARIDAIRRLQKLYPNGLRNWYIGGIKWIKDKPA